MMSIRHKLYKGVFWNSVSQFGSQLINFITIVILARLLDPKDFGLVGMVAVITSFLGYFTEFGLTPTLINKKEIDEGDCNTVYWSTVFFSIVIYMLVFFCAPLVGSFYNDERLTLITRILFINFLCSPLAFIPEVLEIKRLNYNKIAVAELAAVLCSGIIGVLLAYSNFGVWSLVTQQILFTFFRGFILMLATGWLPKLSFSITKFKELSGFGFHFTFRNLISYLSENIDFLLVGKLLGPAALGIYAFSFKVAKYPIMKFYQIFGRMFFPAFASFREEKERVKRNLIRVNLGGGFLLIPLLTAIFFIIKPLILLLVGEKWIATVPVIQILIVYLAFTSICFADESLLIVLGKIRMVNVIKLSATLALLSGGYLATKKYGIIGMAIIFTVVSILYDLIIKRKALKMIDLDFILYLKNLKIIFCMTLILSLALGAYSFLAFKFCKLPIVFLLGGGLVLVVSMAIFVLTNNLIDFKAKRVNIDRIIILDE